MFERINLTGVEVWMQEQNKLDRLYFIKKFFVTDEEGK
jgi:hypothetical protein